jgi:Ser-tRNA(Ala) deacylase AlaX
VSPPGRLWPTLRQCGRAGSFLLRQTKWSNSTGHSAAVLIRSIAAATIAFALTNGCTGCSGSGEQARLAMVKAQQAELKAEQAEAAANRARAAAQQAEIAAERAQKAVEDATREINRVAEHLDRMNHTPGGSD